MPLVAVAILLVRLVVVFAVSCVVVVIIACVQLVCPPVLNNYLFCSFSTTKIRLFFDIYEFLLGFMSMFFAFMSMFFARSSVFFGGFIRVFLVFVGGLGVFVGCISDVPWAPCPHSCPNGGL